MSCKHNGCTDCKHENMKYCDCCDAAFCVDCKREWKKHTSNYIPYYYPYTYTYTSNGNIQSAANLSTTTAGVTEILCGHLNTTDGQ